MKGRHASGKACRPFLVSEGGSVPELVVWLVVGVVGTGSVLAIFWPKKRLEKQWRKR